MAGALQIIPTSITMVDSLSKALQNIPDVSSLIGKVTAKIAETGITAKTAAISTAAFFGSFLIADQALNAIPEDMQAIAGALTASIAAIVAATIAWMAFHGTMTIGVAVPIILAAVGVGIAGVKAAIALANGGVVEKPTLALIGEAGPEVVIPLSHFQQQLSFPTIKKTIEPQHRIINISITQQFYGDINSPEYVEQAADKTIEKLNEKLSHWR